MKLHRLLAFTLAVLLGTAFAGPKPANTYCDTAEVIIPGVTHDEVVSSRDHREGLRNVVLNEVVGLGPLEGLIADDSVFMLLVVRKVR